MSYSSIYANNTSVYPRVYTSHRGWYGIYRTRTATGTVLTGTGTVSAGRPAVSPVLYPSSTTFESYWSVSCLGWVQS
jgi:hypothetical protein